MRNFVFLNVSILLISILSGCGQSGALILPADQNYDKRSQYLLYRDKQDRSKADVNENQNTTRVQNSFPAQSNDQK